MRNRDRTAWVVAGIIFVGLIVAVVAGEWDGISRWHRQRELRAELRENRARIAEIDEILATGHITEAQREKYGISSPTFRDSANPQTPPPAPNAGVPSGPLWEVTGEGDSIIPVPPTVSKVNMTGSGHGLFAVWCFGADGERGGLILNVGVRPNDPYSGVKRLGAPCDEVDITADGVTWRLREQR